MTRIDRRALRLAIEVCRREPGRDEQITAKLKTETWESVGRFCSTVAQGRKLDLKPWQLCPCDVLPAEVETSPPHHQAHAAFELQRRMLRLKISKFHPDPLAAIAEAEAARPRASAK